MDVLPFIMTEEDVLNLPQDFLATLASCASVGVLNKCKEYISNPKANPKAKAKIEFAFLEVFNQNDFNTSEEILAKVKELEDLRLIDIHYDRSEEYLEGILESINLLFVENEIKAYDTKVKGDVVSSLIELVDEYIKLGKPLKDFKEGLSMSKHLFKSPVHAKHTATPFKNIVRRRNDYMLMAEGIRFILDQKANNSNPKSWRNL